MRLLTTAFCAALLGPTLTAQDCSAKQDTWTAAAECSDKAAGPDLVDVAVAAGSFETLTTAVKAAGLVDALKADGPFTIFAPRDSAFAALPEGTVESLLRPDQKGTLTGILTYHVVPGRLAAADVVKQDVLTTLNGQRLEVQVDDSGVSIDGAQVVTTDIKASNGIIHVIDAVMLPAGDDIVATALANGNFKTLAAALQAADLVEALQGEGPFTVFAPTDAAFAALPEGTVESLLRPENRDQLVKVLTYHVVPGRVYSDQAVAAVRADSLQGQTLGFAIRDGQLRVNASSGVVASDIQTSNGVIHVIDSVLLPE